MNGETSHKYMWDDMEWAVPLIFFVPLVLVVLKQLRSPRLRMLVTMSAPVVAACLLLHLGHGHGPSGLQKPGTRAGRLDRIGPGSGGPGQG